VNIYAIRDRLLNYFMRPFVGDGDKQVLAAVAKGVNSEERNVEIAQAPHHFEVWRLATLDEDGHVVVSREFLADCSSLVRASVRETDQPTANSPAITARQSQGQALRDQRHTGQPHRPVPGASTPTDAAAGPTHRTDRGGDPAAV